MLPRDTEVRSTLIGSVSGLDPIQFVMLETLLIEQTMARVPKWTPSTGLIPSKFRRYRQRKALVDQVETMCNDMWLELTRGILQYHAGSSLRAMQWAEELRKMRDTQNLELEGDLKRAEIADRLAQLESIRTIENTRVLERLRAVYDRELEAMRQGKDDPFHQAQRYKMAMDLFKPALDEIAASGHTNAVKNQLSKGYLEAMKLILR
jgi:hypothetical protein